MSRASIQLRRDAIAMSRAVGRFTDDVVRDYDALLAVADAAAAVMDPRAHRNPGENLVRTKYLLKLRLRDAIAALEASE